MLVRCVIVVCRYCPSVLDHIGFKKQVRSGRVRIVWPSDDSLERDFRQRIIRTLLPLPAFCALVVCSLLRPKPRKMSSIKTLMIWSCPRSRSTVLERPFLTRDDVEVVHEPMSEAWDPSRYALQQLSDCGGAQPKRDSTVPSEPAAPTRRSGLRANTLSMQT